MNQYDKVGLTYVGKRKQKESIKAAESGKFLMDNIDFENKSVLDLGCGAAADFPKYVKAGANRVFGIDSSSVMIDQAKLNISTQSGCEVLKSDIADISFNADFDIIIAKYSLHYLKDLEVIWKKCATALKPGGVLAFTVPHPFFETYLKNSRDYSNNEQIEYIAHDNVLLNFPSHTIADYLSIEFLKYFNLKFVWEYTKKEELVNDIIAPVVLGVVAVKK